MPGGRPLSLTPEIRHEIIDAVEHGVYLETAAAIAGVARSTLYLWLRQGRKAKEGPQAEFLAQVKRSLARREADDVRAIRTAGERSWQAVAWLLERRYPHRWGAERFAIATIRREIAEIKAQLNGQSPPAPEDAAATA